LIIGCDGWASRGCARDSAFGGRDSGECATAGLLAEIRVAWLRVVLSALGWLDLGTIGRNGVGLRLGQRAGKTEWGGEIVQRHGGGVEVRAGFGCAGLFIPVFG
jgi:hypothetical protein